MTVTQKHIAPLHPRFPTWDGNRFCRTTLERRGLERWGFKTLGCKNVSLTRFQTTLSSVERKRLFPCIPGCMCASLIFSFTLSLRVTPFTHLLEETDMLLSQSLQVWAYFLSIFVNLFVYHFEIMDVIFNSPKSNLGAVIHVAQGNCTWVFRGHHDKYCLKTGIASGKESKPSTGGPSSSCEISTGGDPWF